jgi:hypothetical protein
LTGVRQYEVTFTQPAEREKESQSVRENPYTKVISSNEAKNPLKEWITHSHGIIIQKINAQKMNGNVRMNGNDQIRR